MRAAVIRGNSRKLADLIRKDPGFDVNSQDGEGATLLHHACVYGKDSVIPLLLAHPDIDANLKESRGWTPFWTACFRGHTSCVRLLLKDFRVKVNKANNDVWTPLWFAAANGHVDVIRWWIASGRDLDLGKPGDVDKTDAIGAAKEEGKTEVVNLLERFKGDAAKTRSEVRLELGITGESVHPAHLSSFPFFFFFLFFCICGI